MKSKITLLFFALLSYSAVQAQCIGSFTYLASPANNGDVAFTDTIMNSNSYSLFWSFGDGTSATGNNPNHTFNTGTWNVCLTVVDSMNNFTCTYCDTVVVTNNNLPGCNASFMAFDSLGYGYFYDMSTGSGLTYYWNFGDGTTSTAVGSTTHLYSANGTYYVCLTIANSFLGCTNTFCDSVTIGNNSGTGGTCSATFSTVNDMTGNGVSFNSSVSGTADTYTWTFGDGTSSTLANPHHIYSSSGTYTACLFVTSSTDTACHYSTCQSVAAGVPSGGCTANFVIIQDSTNLYNYWVFSYATNNSTTGYFWDFGDGTNSSLQFPNHTYTGTGPYYLCLTITDSANAGMLCTASYCDSISPGHGVSQATTLNVYNGLTMGIAQQNTAVESLENYPNPFSDATTISYSLSKNSTVELSIVDLLGNKIAMVESGSRTSGSHKVNFDASGISAGIYLLQLKSDNKMTTKKLVIAK